MSNVSFLRGNTFAPGKLSSISLRWRPVRRCQEAPALQRSRWTGTRGARRAPRLARRLATSAMGSTKAEPRFIVAYWDDRAIGEQIRLLLEYVGEEYEDLRYQVGPPPDYDKASWLSVKEHLGLPFPNLPYLVDNGTGLKLTQMHSILRFLGAEHGLAGRDAREAALADLALEAARDWINELFGVTYCDAPWVPDADPACHVAGTTQCKISTPKFEALKAAYEGSTLPLFLGRLDDMLEAGGGPWVAGDSLTYADFAVFECLDQHEVFAPGCLAGAPRVAAYKARFEALPRVAAYRASARFKPEPLHNKYSHFHCGWLAAS